MQPPKLLTVIISFLNEGYEVERTVSSVLEFAENKVDILVINDGSNSLLESPQNDLTRYCQKRNMEISIADYIRYRFNNAYIKSHRT